MNPLPRAVPSLPSSPLSSFASLAVAGVCLLACASAAFGGDVTLEVSANRDRLYLGESVLLTVKVNGDANPPAPDLSAVTNATVRLLDSRSQNWSSMTIINGQVTRTGFSGRIFTYEITPAAPGRLTVGAVALTVGGKTIRTPGPVVEVAGIEQQNTVAVAVSASRATVLVDEPFDITLTVAVRLLPGDLDAVEPLDPAEPPSLSAPYLEGAPIAGLESPDVAGVLRQRVESRRDRPGFAINNYTVQSSPMDFDNFFNMNMDDFMAGPRKAKFALEKQRTTRDGSAWVEYRIAFRYAPRREGDYTFGPAIFKGPVLVGRDDAGRLLKRPFFAVGPACTVRVVPPPEEGRPPSYIGAVGTDMRAEASLDAQTCNVGDPLKLTLRISGNVNMENLVPPQLGLQTNMVKSFRVYDDTVQVATRNGAREYQYTVRPIAAGTIEVPPVEVCFFNTGTRRYETVRTAPIPVRANEAAEVGYEIVIAGDTNLTAAGPAASGGPRPTMAPMSADPAGAGREELGLRRWQWTLCLAAPAGWALGASLRRLRSLVAEALRRRRRHGALGRALHRLGEAAASASGREAARGLCEALSGYLSARLDAAGRGMTPADVGPALEARGVEAGLAGELAAVWQRGFDAVYASAEPEAAPMGEACRRAAELLREMDARLRRGRRDKGSAARAALILAAALLLAPRGARAGGDAERGFLWEEANSLLAVAQTEEECLRAAETYARLVEAGARNAPLFYNLGTALLKAGRHEDALAALRRAERYSGSNPEIRRNMLLAVAGRDGTEHPALPWTRSFLFWHYDLGLAARLSIAVVAFAGIWIALLLRALRASRVSSALLSLSLVALCAFGSSAAASLHQEYRDAAAGYHFRPPAVPQPSGGNAP